jgi:hypothetical protein
LFSFCAALEKENSFFIYKMYSFILVANIT